jgi:hypothetical protein
MGSPKMLNIKTMRQSSYLLHTHLVRLILVMLAAPVLVAPVEAQDRYRVVEDNNFRREPRPDGRLLATVKAGAEMTADSTLSGWLRVTVEGWIWSRSVSSVAGGFDLEVTASSGENLRSSPNGDIVARLGRGFRLREQARDGDWVRVSRVGWMWGRSLQRVASQAVSGGSVTPEPADPPPAQTSAPPVAGNVGLDYAVTSHATALRRTPSGDTTGTLDAESPVRIVGRSGEWVRVQTEGWVRETDLRPGSEGVLIGVSGAEVRAQPRAFEGKVVQWLIQYISVQTGDDLRPEIPVGQPYMLARGPLPEAGFLYLLLSQDQVAALDKVAPLAQIDVIAQVRVGRTRYLGNPVLEVVDMSVRQP